jgi:hypothetical protein
MWPTMIHTDSKMSELIETGRIESDMKYVGWWQRYIILLVNFVQLQKLSFWKKLLSPSSSYIKGTPHVEHYHLLPQCLSHTEGILQFENLKKINLLEYL